MVCNEEIFTVTSFEKKYMLNNNNKFIDNFPPVIYHYCTMENFCKIFATDTLKLTNITKSNDLKEVIYVREHLNKV